MRTITAKIAEAESVLLAVWREVLPLGDRRAEILSRSGAERYMSNGRLSINPCLIAVSDGLWDSTYGGERSLALLRRLDEIRAS